MNKLHILNIGISSGNIKKFVAVAKRTGPFIRRNSAHLLCVNEEIISRTFFTKLMANKTQSHSGTKFAFQWLGIVLDMYANNFEGNCGNIRRNY